MGEKPFSRHQQRDYHNAKIGRHKAMHNIRKITEDLIYIGANDRRITRFENLHPVPNGMSYNSYLLLDEKTVLLDTVDKEVGDLFLENLHAALKGRALDYMIIQHMEPDHCALIPRILELYPQVKVAGSQKTFGMIQQFLGWTWQNARWS